MKKLIFSIHEHFDSGAEAGPKCMQCGGALNATRAEWMQQASDKGNLIAQLQVKVDSLSSEMQQYQFAFFLKFTKHY